MASHAKEGNTDGIDWTEIRARILAGIDVAGEWQRFGLRIKKGARPDADGWLSCHALDRSDKNPSCSINVKSGYYKTYTGDPGIRFWDAAVKFAGHADYWAAVRHYADIAHVTLPSGGGGGKKSSPSSTWTAPPKKEEKPQPCLHALVEPMQRRAESNGDLVALAKSYGWRMDAVKRMRFGSPDPKDRKFYPAKKGEKYVPRIYSPECEVDADGIPTVTSFFGRSPTKDPTVTKFAMRKKRRGLTIPDGILRDANRTGILFGSEGSSDTCTLLCMRLGAVAYYSAGSGGQTLGRLIKRAIDTRKLRADIRIVLTIDNDDYGCGWRGTANVGTDLANILQRPIYRMWMDHNPDHEDGDTKIVAPEKPDPRYEEEDYYGCGTGFATRPTPRYDPSKSSAYKDVREWFAAAHGSAFGWTDEQAIAAGNEFCKGLDKIGSHDWLQDDDIRVFHPETPTEPAKPTESTEVAESTYFTTETIERCPEEADRYPLKLGEVIPEEDLIKDSGPDVPAVTVPVAGLRATVAWDESPLTAISATCRHRCPRGSHKVGTRRNGGTAGVGFRVSCCSWRCVGCGPRLRLEWATLARRIFRGEVTAFTELFVWRGDQVKFTKCGRKRINEANGDFIRITTTGGDCLVIATVPFFDATPIEPIDADREFVAAVVAYVPPEVGRHQPIAKSTPWGVVRCGSGQFVIAGTFRGTDADVNASYDVLEQMGCIPGVTGKDGFRRCEWPAEWGLASRQEAIVWASIQVYPPGFVVGDDYVAPLAETAHLLLELPVEIFDDLDDGKATIVVATVVTPAPAPPPPSLFDDSV